MSGAKLVKHVMKAAKGIVKDVTRKVAQEATVSLFNVNKNRKPKTTPVRRRKESQVNKSQDIFAKTCHLLVSIPVIPFTIGIALHSTPTHTAVDKTYDVENQPLTSLENTVPLEFYVAASTNDYFDLKEK